MQEPAGRKRDIHVERGGKPSRSARWARSASDEAAYHAINRFAASAARHLYLRFALSHLMQSGAGIFDAETYISTQPAQALEEARVPDSHEDQERSRRALPPAGQGTQARIREAGFPRLISRNRKRRPSLSLSLTLCAGLWAGLRSGLRSDERRSQAQWKGARGESASQLPARGAPAETFRLRSRIQTREAPLFPAPDRVLSAPGRSSGKRRFGKCSSGKTRAHWVHRGQGAGRRGRAQPD